MTRTRYGLSGVLIALLLLSGCSNGSTPTGGGVAASEPAAAPAAPAMVDLAAVASAIGCTGYVDASADSPLTREYGTCDLGGSTVQLYRFGTPEAIETFWEVSAGFGATPDQCASQGLIVACPARASDLAAIQAAL